MARRLRSVIAASCAVAAVLALAAPVLSQSYEYRYSKIKAASETVDPELPLPEGACLAPWQEELLSGESVVAFSSATVESGGECAPETRTCTNGTLNGSFEHALCVTDVAGNYADPISFAPVSDSDTKIYHRSTIEQVTGLDGATPIAQSGTYSRFRICADAGCAAEIRPFSSRSTTIAPGQYVQIERRSSDKVGTAVETRLQVGMTQATFSVSTRDGLGCEIGGIVVPHDETWDFFLHDLHASCASVMDDRKCVDGTLLGDATHDKPFCELIDQDRLPDAFSFSPLVDRNPNQTVYSDPVLLGGFDWKVPVSITRTGTSIVGFSICRAGRECGVDGQFNTWMSSPGSVQAGDSIRLRMRTPATVQSDASIDVTVGQFSTTWNVSTKPGLSCPSPWGSDLAHGESLVAYGAESVDFGTECPMETRLCSNGTLQGSYVHQSCVVNEQDLDPNDLTIAAVTDAEAYATVLTGFLQPSGFTGALPVKVGTGDLAASRVCDTASGASCTAFNGADKTVLPGQFLQFRLRAADFGETRILPIEIGPLTKSWTVAARPGATCNAPWGGQLAHGASVPAFREASVPFGLTCSSENRICSDGALSGSNLYQQPSCTVEPQVIAIDPFPLGSALDVNRFSTNLSNQVQLTGFTGQIPVELSAPAGITYSVRRCTSANCPNSGWGTYTSSSSITMSPGNWFQIRATSPDFGLVGDVTATALGHAETFAVRTRAAYACTTPWGATIQHGNGVTAWNTDVAPYNTTCQSTNRNCSDGYLQGTTSYTYQACTQDNIPRPNAFSFVNVTVPAGTTQVKSGSVQITGTVGSIPVTVTGPTSAYFNRNANSACGTGTWVEAYSNVNMNTNAYLCLRVDASPVPGQSRSLTVKIGDKTVVWTVTSQ